MTNKNSNPKIEILPEHIIDQIKAGEVLERPASLVKELIENSLDAQSNQINIHLIENGLDLLSIEDNGHGISFENLPYAFLRHATSKLKTYDDLFHLHSFGFRGEALASVAASARVTCTSQPQDSNTEGGKIIIHGGSQELLIPYHSSTHGTSLYIKDLFYNTPARLKFIKSKVSEKSALKKMLYAFVLSNPDVSFSIKWDEKEKEIFKSNNPLNRVQQVFFPKITKENNDSIWWASEEYEHYRVEVYFTPSTHTTPQFRHHYLFANNRFFQDKSLHQALLRTLDPLWKHGESGHYIVKITTPSEDIDVNVHPNKTHIKFLKSDIVFSLLVSSLRSAMKKKAIPTNIMPKDLEQIPFFTREQDQNIDLLNRQTQSLSTQKNWGQSPSPLFSDEQSFNMNEPSSPFIVGHIDDQFLLLKIENQFYIGSIKKIMAYYLSKSLKEFIESEEISGPLLISEPFKIPKGKIDASFDELKNLGFELDRLNTEVIALRTLPRFVPQVISRDITNCLISYFKNSKVLCFDQKEFSSFVEINWPEESRIPDYLISQILKDTSAERLALLFHLSTNTLKGLIK